MGVEDMSRCDECGDTGYVHAGIECLKCFAMDAKRYRFLRDQQEFINAEFMVLDIDSGTCLEAMNCLSLSDLDARIDEAICKRGKS